MASQPLPLAGIRVVDYTHFLAGPYLSRCLAGLGAEVIKVERPTAGDAGRHHPYFKDGQSGYFLQQNMGKKGLCVNLKDPRGLDLVHKLARTADVFVENYRPGALNKLGLGYAELSQENPRLVYCSVSAYGHTGPDASRPGFGVIAEAKSGAMAMIGVPGEPPPLFRMPIADMYAGIHGVAAVCAALVGRAATGLGRHVDTALYDCMVGMHDFAVQCYTLSGDKEVPVQTGHDLPQATVYGVFAARDGNLVIAAQVDDAWKRLAKVVGGDALAGDVRFHDPEGRNAGREEILAKVKAWAKTENGQGMHRGARCGGGALFAGAEHRRGARGSAGRSARDDRRAGASGARQGPPRQHPVPVLRLRRDAAHGGAAPGPAQSRDRGEARLLGGGHRGHGEGRRPPCRGGGRAAGGGMNEGRRATGNVGHRTPR